MSKQRRRVGELFVLGFRGLEIPAWLKDFEHRYGLGGVILFDYDCQTRKYENNIESPAQLGKLCAELDSLASRPLLMVDQEGGKVRRLKEKLGFAALPSQLAFNALSAEEQERVTEKSFREMREIGFDFDLTPVIDLNINPENPDIGKVERSYSASADEVRANVAVLNRVAERVGLGLCLKHYPGLGAATVNSHEELTDISGTITRDQLELFHDLGKAVYGGSILVSHGVVREWDTRHPVSMSPSGIERLRLELPDALLLSDDIQMQGLQKILPSPQASIQGLRAGLDLIVIGNNLMAEDAHCLDYAHGVETAIAADPLLEDHYFKSFERVQQRKKLFKKQFKPY